MRPDTPGLSITLDVNNHPVLLIAAADDFDAARKRTLLEAAGARVLDITPAEFTDAAITNARLVLLSTRDPAVAVRVSTAARARAIPVWCSDDPAHSDFAMPAIAQLGSIRIAISTSGGSPTLASRLRAIFEQKLGDRFAAFGRALAARRPTRTIDERRADLDGFDLDLAVRYPDWFTD